MGSEAACEAAVQCVLCLEHSLLHNVSEELDSILHLGSSLASGLHNGNNTDLGGAGTEGSPPFQWLNKAQAVLIGKFRADQAVLAAEEVATLATHAVSSVASASFSSSSSSSSPPPSQSVSVSAALLPLLKTPATTTTASPQRSRPVSP